MANGEALLIQVSGQGNAVDPIVNADGEVSFKAAGRSLGTPAGWSDPFAPQLVEVSGAVPQYLDTPTNLALAQGTGTLGAATYYYRVSATTAAGETLACAEVGLAIAATHGVDLSWDAVAGATGYRVYGRSTGAELFIAATAGGVTTYTDSGSITPSGALPTTNTARVGQVTEMAKPTTGTRTSVASANVDTLLLAANDLRKGATITNHSTQLLYIGMGTAAASATDYTVVLAGAAAAPYQYWECPFFFSGEIRGIWASANGAARVTELV